MPQKGRAKGRPCQATGKSLTVMQRTEGMVQSMGAGARGRVPLTAGGPWVLRTSAGALAPHRHRVLDWHRWSSISDDLE